MVVVGAASSGREAIALAGSLQPDVVLMDINMPDMDGIAATEQLSATVPTAAVVMMSVQGEADYLRRSMLAGAREFLRQAVQQRRALRLDPPGLVARTREGHPTRPAAHRRDRCRPHHGSRPQQRRGQVVAFFSPKGGVGRTTMAVNRRSPRPPSWARRSASSTARSSSATSASCST